MAFDGFITKAVITELKTAILGAKVNKIFVPTKTDVILGLYNNGINYALELCANPDFCRINLTTHSKPNPQNAYNFCMLLRKYLTGGKVISISSYDLERTVEIQFECYNDLNDLVKRKLFIEIMSRQSNVILTNENNIIIDTLRHTDNSTRELLPAHEYTFMPINKTSFINLESFNDFLNIVKQPSEQSLDKILLNNFIGFSRPFIKEILSILNINKENYSENDLKNLFDYINKIISNFGTINVKCKLLNEKDYTLVFNNEYNELDDVPENLRINYFLDDFYYYKENNTLFTNSRNSLLKIVSSSLKKVYKKLENINLKLKECEEMDKFKLYGELLTANLYKVNSASNLDEITIENYYDNNTPITIPLDKKINVHKNVEKYFKKYNKLKNALNIVSEQKKKLKKN